MISCQTNQLNKYLQINSSIECITPTCEELNYETSQVKCPHRKNNSLSDKCQKIFKNIMALNVHLQMCHKETGILTPSNNYTSRVGRYHCPVENCTFHCCCEKNLIQSLSFSNFNAVRLHYLRQHGVKKEQCLKCLKSFGLHQDLIAHEKICGIDCPFSCSNCDQQFQNRTSLRRHQLKYHSDIINDSQNNPLAINFPSLSKVNERRKRPNRRRPIPSNQIEFPRPSSHPLVTVNPLALALLKNLHSDPVSSTPSLIESDSDKSTQTSTRVSVGTECCSLTNADFIPIKTTEQRSSQTTTRIRMYKKRVRSSSKKPSFIPDYDSSNTFATKSLNTYNPSTSTQWENVHVTDMETQIFSPLRSDMCIQTVGDISNLLDYPLETNHSVNIQTLPISMTSTQMQTINEYPFEQPSDNNYSLPDQESVGTSCFFDEFLLDDLAKPDATSSILFDFDAIDLLDLMDNGTQTYSSITTNETQTISDWDNLLLNEDEWIQTIMNSS